ncbi:hypothetical protein BH11CYA1_BH11CYA1_40770 [soil metagenome]
MNKALLLALGSMMIFSTSVQAKVVHSKNCAKKQGTAVSACSKKAKAETRNVASIKSAPARKPAK